MEMPPGHHGLPQMSEEAQQKSFKVTGLARGAILVTMRRDSASMNKGEERMIPDFNLNPSHAHSHTPDNTHITYT